MNLQEGERLGILAGEGDLPLLVAQNARARGLEPVTVTFSARTAEALRPLSSSLLRCGVGQTGKIIRFLREEGVCAVVFVGKLEKRMMYRNPILDLRAVRVLRRIKDRRDDSLMLAIIEEIESEGFPVLPQAEFLGDLFPKVGVLSKRAPTKREREDLEFGFTMAKGVAALDLGQTVVVRNKAVVAVESIEGTDEAIRRGCAIAGRGTVAVKVAKPRQDPRFDVPVVGEGTLRALAEGGGTALGIEAERTMIVGHPAFLEAARKWKIAVVSMEQGEGEASH
ncbi:MAG: UDP-2,3-diacylglucosamine diphosphatase LpxI [bacterium]